MLTLFRGHSIVIVYISPNFKAYLTYKIAEAIMSNLNVKKIDDAVIRFSGDSGDGMQLTGGLFSDTAAYYGRMISTYPDFPSEIRAPQGTVSGVSGFQVRFGNNHVLTPGDYCDLLIAMNPAALRANAQWLKRGATVVIDKSLYIESQFSKAGFKTDDPIEELGLENHNVVVPDISAMTLETLKEFDFDRRTALRSKNMFALGICLRLSNFGLKHTEESIERRYGKNPAVVEANRLVLRAGYNFVEESGAFSHTYEVAKADFKKGRYRTISGNQATAWGLIAASSKSGRGLFCGSYPITPATTILEELALRKECGVKTLQAEDEIAAIGTAIGAAWAGSLAVTSTSGPGLSLKTEAMGLAVMTELPLIVINVQRGGPSTGLPTKIEQTDLFQSLWGRNGECPMIVMAASSPTDCFDYAFEAAKLSLEHMTPVLLLSDALIANSSQPWLIPSTDNYPKIKPPIVSPNKDSQEPFMPYARDVERLARRWAIPGTEGLEHRVGGLEKDSLTGEVSQEPENHQKMVETRAEKVARVENYIPIQSVIGQEKGDLLVVGWGGTKGHLKNAVAEMSAEGKSVSLCHFNYINPLPKGVEEIFSNFKKIVVCELNKGQFANYLRMNFQKFKILQYNKVMGVPFTVAELKEEFNRILESR